MHSFYLLHQGKFADLSQIDFNHQKIIFNLIKILQISLKTSCNS
ncbi:hypothetical protein L291_0160 [Acinetobacter guillouiae MSP4-18]|nr:hypothetical protein L291_0160 [Acinetobacter guillouiae MSP4-18]BAP35376.1 hypothetical protein AS4_04360 [Acinetobacter guillouiae]